MTWEDINAWCDELNSWIIEIGEEEELAKAFPKGSFPLKADPKEDEIEESRDILAYLTVWMCCKRRTPAPTGLHNRILLGKPFKGPWQRVYAGLLDRWERNQDFKDLDIFSLFNLAS